MKALTSLKNAIATMLTPTCIAGLIAAATALMGTSTASAQQQWVSGCTVTNVMAHEGGCFRVQFSGCTVNPPGWTEFYMLRSNDSTAQAQALALAAFLSGRKVGFFADSQRPNTCNGTRPYGLYLSIAN